jgi:hypothetical protein
MRSYGMFVTYLVAAMAAMVAFGVLFVASPATGQAVTIVAPETDGPATIEPTVSEPAPMAGEDVDLPRQRGRIVLPIQDGNRRDGRIRVHSIDDLARLNDDELRRLQRADEDDVDVNPYRLRDDVNGGLHRLGANIRGLNFSYHISGVRNAAGTAWTGGSGYREPVEYEFHPARYGDERDLQVTMDPDPQVIVLPQN